MFSVQMLVNTEKGGTFSFNEIKKWLEDAGFKKSTETRSAWAITAHSGNKTVAVPYYESASHPRVEMFDSCDEKNENEVALRTKRPGLRREALSEVFPTVNRRFAATHSSGL